MTGSKSFTKSRLPDLSYDIEVYGEEQSVVLPLMVGVIGDFCRNSQTRPEIESRRFVELTTENLEEVISSWAPVASADGPGFASTVSGQGLAQLVALAGRDPGIEVRAMDFSMDELKSSFLRASGTTQACVFKTVYEHEFGQFGGKPFGLMLVDFEFTRSASDISLLEDLARTGAEAGCLFITPAGPGMFGADGWQELSDCDAITELFTSAAYIDWRELVRSPYSRMLAFPVPDSGLEKKDASREAGFALTAAIVQHYSQTRGWNVDAPQIEGGIGSPGFDEAQLDQLLESGFAPISQLNHTSLDLNTTLTAGHFLRTLKCILRDKIGSFREDTQAVDFLNSWLRDYTTESSANSPTLPDQSLVEAWLDYPTNQFHPGYADTFFHLKVKNGNSESVDEAIFEVRFTSSRLDF